MTFRRVKSQTQRSSETAQLPQRKNTWNNPRDIRSSGNNPYYAISGECACCPTPSIYLECMPLLRSMQVRPFYCVHSTLFQTLYIGTFLDSESDYFHSSLDKSSKCQDAEWGLTAIDISLDHSFESCQNSHKLLLTGSVKCVADPSARICTSTSAK